MCLSILHSKANWTNCNLFFFQFCGQEQNDFKPNAMDFACQATLCICGGGGGSERNVQKTFSVAKSICESSLIQREIVLGQSIQHLHVSKSITKVICFL